MQILIKFWDGSCASLKRFAPFGRNDRGGSCYEKKCSNFLAAMAKRVVQWSKAKINSCFLPAIMENRFHKLSFYFIRILTELLIWIFFLFWCQNWGHFHQLKLVKCDNYLLRSTIHYLHYNNWITVPHPGNFSACRFLEVKDWIVKWHTKTLNGCGWGSKNIWC